MATHISLEHRAANGFVNNLANGIKCLHGIDIQCRNQKFYHLKSDNTIDKRSTAGDIDFGFTLQRDTTLAELLQGLSCKIEETDLGVIIRAGTFVFAEAILGRGNVPNHFAAKVSQKLQFYCEVWNGAVHDESGRNSISTAPGSFFLFLYNRTNADTAVPEFPRRYRMLRCL